MVVVVEENDQFKVSAFPDNFLGSVYNLEMYVDCRILMYSY